MKQHDDKSGDATQAIQSEEMSPGVPAQSHISIRHFVDSARKGRRIS
jgi:hypothetical protein